MSILHHFGQVKRKYEPYVSPVPGFTGYLFESKDKRYLTSPLESGRFGIKIKFNQREDLISINDKLIALITINEESQKQYQIDPTILSNQVNIFNMKKVSIGNGHYTEEKSVGITETFVSSLSPESYVFSMTTLTETFSKCLTVVREKIENTIWKTIECCPFVNIMDLLILKHYDTDARLQHLEKMIVGLMDDNKTLQTKINSLEQQMSLRLKKKEKDIPYAEEVWFELE